MDDDDDDGGGGGPVVVAAHLFCRSIAHCMDGVQSEEIISATPSSHFRDKIREEIVHSRGTELGLQFPFSTEIIYARLGESLTPIKYLLLTRTPNAIVSI